MELTKKREQGIAVLRVLMGLLFLYAGVEKLLAIGLTIGQKWSAAGFLKFATAGSWPNTPDTAIVNPFHDFWVSLGSNAAALPFINLLVPFGELAIGVALVLGLGTRFASVMGTLLMGLFFLASWDFSLGIINSDLVYLVVIAYLGYARAGEIYGLDGYVKRLSFVKQTPPLRFVLG